MKKFTLLIFLAIKIILTPDAVAGAKQKGFIGSNDQFKYQVSIQRNGAHVCGGVILGDKFVGSAAQCVYNTVTKKFDEGRLTVIAAINNLRALTAAAETTHVQKIYMPKSYLENSDEHPFRGDFVVLQTKYAFGLFNKNKLMKLKVVETYHVLTTDTVDTTGFGYQASKYRDEPRTKNPLGVQKPYGKLRLMKSKIYTNSKCNKFYNNLIEGSNICTFSDHGDRKSCDGTCLGDSGSPLVYNDTILFGILIAGSMDCSCSDQPSVYSNVFYYMSFIRHALKDMRTPNMVVATWKNMPDGIYRFVEDQPSKISDTEQVALPKLRKVTMPKVEFP